MTNYQSVMKYRQVHPDRYKQYQRDAYIRFRELMDKLKNKPCLDCRGWFNPWQMQFDHRPGSIKLYQISKMTNYSIKKILNEVSKCDVVCSNCHDDRTYRRYHGD